MLEKKYSLITKVNYKKESYNALHFLNFISNNQKS